MCGIVGYVGKQKAASLIVEGLKRLEYRGYDSAGIAYLKMNKRQTARQYFEKARDIAPPGPLADEINRYLKLLR